jgi:hypothetical protein
MKRPVSRTLGEGFICRVDSGCGAGTGGYYNAPFPCSSASRRSIKGFPASSLQNNVFYIIKSTQRP